MSDTYEAPYEAEQAGNALIPETPPEPTEAPKETEAPAGNQRPAWLPEKFSRPEDMALAYANLEARMSATPKSGDTTNTEGQPAPAESTVQPIDQGTMQQLYDEFAMYGSITPQSYNMLLNNYGITRDVADSHISALQGQAEAQAQTVYSMVGGKDEWNAMIGWAQREMPTEKREGYNQMIAQANASGNMSLVRTAVDQMRAEWQASEGARPKQPGGYTTPAPGGNAQSEFGPVTPFKSDQELHAAQKDRRYQERADYRDWVYRRINAGGI